MYSAYGNVAFFKPASRFLYAKPYEWYIFLAHRDTGAIYPRYQRKAMYTMQGTIDHEREAVWTKATPKAR